MVCYCDCDFVCDLTYECVWIGLSGLPALGCLVLGLLACGFWFTWFALGKCRVRIGVLTLLAWFDVLCDCTV